MSTAVGGHSLDLSCPPDDVTAVHTFLEHVWGTEPTVSAEDRMALELALVELASNVIEHGADGAGVSCTLRLDVGADAVEANLVDDGVPVPVDPSAARLPDALAESGRGLALVQMVVDDLHYERVGDHNRWTVRRGRH
ncbi:serine/threonine-protein kinase RsbW [Curtobacterium sp. UNCCL20]|uniref:ATP-binding protein n=1 Tax=Curtobacterium sp. UNCCL20 TaxID=1502773 RepID=UPI0008855E6A|nr:ATP-binding protein [Curtobacterium sp. UNCCL20]SDR02057.1 serine/threonine-protein kinase RsbW [Curtobacterium sp. UNCCL20]